MQLACLIFNQACDPKKISEAQKSMQNEQPAQGPTKDTIDNKLKPLPELPATAGQIVFTLKSEIEPSSVTGYVVGKKDLLKVERAATGEFFVNNVPAGIQEVIILGQSSNSTAATSLVNDAADRGLRLSDVEVINGRRSTKDNLSLPTLSTMSGRVTLFGQSNHAGTVVYIPGTGFSAFSDANGEFSISGIPSGNHEIYFERTGYYRGRLKNFSVEAGADLRIPQINLSLDTGADGFILLANGVNEIDSRKIPVTIGATDDAVLMKISEDINFIGKKWVPVSSALEYTFSSEGPKTLFVKFANANGLETSAYSANIIVRLFPASNQLIIANGAVKVNSRTVDVSMSKARNAAKMKISERADFAGADWTDVETHPNFTFSGIGNKQAFLKFQDAEGFESPVYLSNTVLVELFGINEGAIVVDGGYSLTKSRTVNLSITKPVNAAFI